ncbi:malate dehydrogenase [Candidatus Woesearchaeota archaeon CG10_big_fil_rev_8_21_14_0_10_44_13]|nr:MAG: malate dehydrogenase [Candidatus Woesearchaeota archaeon CG10_big_fil_rev_8_21_14_0_10_44_13]
MKISVIGAGNVGASAALKLCEKGLAEDVVLVDIMEGIPQGKSLDISQAMPLNSSNTKIKGTNDYSEIRDSDIVIVTAGVPRKPGMTRDDLFNVNATITKSIAKEIKLHAPDSIIIVVTNPLDVMAYLMMKETGSDKSKIIGMAGVLDSARFRAFLAMETGAKVEDIEAMVLGGHGDSMVPLAEHIMISGKQVSGIISKKKLQQIIQRTKDGGAEIVKYLKTGSAYYAPAAAIVEMVESILKEDGKILPCSVYLEGEYGYSDIFIGVPVKLCREGIKEIVELNLTGEEKALLDRSAGEVKDTIKNFNI